MGEATPYSNEQWAWHDGEDAPPPQAPSTPMFPGRRPHKHAGQHTKLHNQRDGSVTDLIHSDKHQLGTKNTFKRISIYIFIFWLDPTTIPPFRSAVAVFRHTFLLPTLSDLGDMETHAMDSNLSEMCVDRERNPTPQQHQPTHHEGK